MALSTPQYQDHKFINQLKAVNNWIFYVIAVCSAFPVAELYFHGAKAFETIIIILNVASLVIYFALDFIIDYYLYPLAEDARKADFIDNSWGTQNVLKNSEKYYDNDDIGYGLYKMSVNLFQNALFTYCVGKAMRGKKYVVNLMFSVTILVIACYGFKNVPIAVPLLQVVFSSIVLGDLFKHLVLVNRVKQAIEKWQSLFQQPEFRKQPDKYRAQVYVIWLYYESTLARTQISLSEEKFNALNQRLTHEWEQIKKKYNIS